MLKRSVSILLTILAGLLWQLPASAQEAPIVETNGSYVINLREVEIRSLSEQVSQITGRTLILEPSVRGQVTVISSDPLSAEGVWQLYRSVLRVNGYAALESDDNWRIVPQNDITRSGTEIYDGRQDTRAQDLVTRMVRLRNLPADSAKRVLSPLVASFGYLEATSQPNAIIVTEYAENVRRIETLALMLDKGQGDNFETITLQYASAAQISETIGRILGGQGENGGGIGPRIAVDERSNTIIVRGDDQSVANIRNLIRSLDEPGGAVPITRVFRLNHTDAEVIADIIRGVIGGPQAASNPVARSLQNREIGAGPTGSANIGYGNMASSMLGGNAGSSGSRATQETPPAEGTAANGFTSGAVAIQPSSDLNAIVVRGTPAAVAEIEALITELDTRQPQVMIEAAIVEITGQQAEQLGVQLGFVEGISEGGFAATSFSSLGRSLRGILTTLGEPVSVGLIEDGLSAGYSPDDNFGILVQALANSTSANLLSTPSLTTLDNQPAEIIVGQNVPFRTGSFTTSGNSTNPFTTIERQDVGITMRVIPRVHQGDVIRLEVSQEVSSLVNGNVAGAADLITNRRSIRTTVLADNGGTIVLGGLITDDLQSAQNKVPVVGDVPVVGRLFRSDRETSSKRTLFVFLRPTILRDRADVSTISQQRYDRVQRLDQLERDEDSLLLEGKAPKLPLELEGIY